ncbi:hypothetical protein [Sorangium sp. So ce861]|uniref:hypothetical protein n=1 Tax=Sorangium sp. So ce861 TaxID=3133323 RepID=UPI003F5E1499
MLGNAAVRFANLSQIDSDAATSGTGSAGIEFETKRLVVRVMYVTGSAREINASEGDAGFGRSILIPNTAPNSFWFDARTNIWRGLGPRAYFNASGSTWKSSDPEAAVGTPEALPRQFDVTQISFGASLSYMLDLSRAAGINDQSIHLIFDAGYGLRRVDADDATLIAGALGSNNQTFHGFEASVMMRVNALRVSAGVPIFGGDVAGLSGPKFVLTLGVEGSFYDIVSPSRDRQAFVPGDD